jgi:hypothetical protein
MDLPTEVGCASRRFLRRPTFSVRDAIARSQPLWLAPDYAAGILWDDKGPIDFVERSLPVSTGLRADLLAFAHFCEYEVQDDSTEEAAHEQGRVLAQRVANELGRTVQYEGAEFRP